MKTNIIAWLWGLLRKHWPEGEKTLDEWLEAFQKVQHDNPKIGDLVVVWKNGEPTNYNIGLLEDCRDDAGLGCACRLVWKLKDGKTWYDHCRRMCFSDLDEVRGFGLEIEERKEEE